MEKDLEIMLHAFPSELEGEIKCILKEISVKTNLYNDGVFDVLVSNEILHIPERIYTENIDENLEVNLTHKQMQILDCFFSRHNNGYIRQKRLNNIFNSGIIYSWAIPYIIRLMGEYVVEIIDDIHKNIEIIDETALKEFIKNNERFILTIEGRIASYYGEFYKSEYKKDKYVGFKVKKYIQRLRKNL